MTHDRLPEQWLDAAREYNEPPTTPREEIWAGIERRRGAAGRGLPATTGRRRSRGSGRSLGRRAVAWTGVGGLAAAAAFAALVLVGPDAPAPREPEPGSMTQHPSAPGEAGRVPQSSPTAPDGDAAPADPRPQSARAVAAAGERDGSSVPEHDAGAPLAIAGREPESTADVGAGAEHAQPEITGSPLEDAPWRKALADATLRGTARTLVLDHLAEVETIVAAVRSDLAAGSVHAAVPDRAGELLAATRIHLDGRVAGDPGLRDLLEDVELVLAQIAATRTVSGEWDVVADAIEQSGLMTRLYAVLLPTLAAAF